MLKSFIGWIFVVLWLLVALVPLVNPELGTMLSGTSVDMLFAIILGIVLLGGRNTIIFYLITFVIVIVMENISIATGFPYGFFTHFFPGPRILEVPAVAGLGYFNFAMISWVTADLILGSETDGSRWTGLLGRPLLGMIIASAMDTLQDPIGVLVQKLWEYPNGGGYFGVPLSNSFGWLLSVFIMLFLLELLMNCKSNAAEHSVRPVTIWHLQTSVILGLHVLTPFLAFLSTPNIVLTDVFGKTWYSSDLYETLSLVGLHTVVFFMILGILAYVQRRKEALRA